MNLPVTELSFRLPVPPDLAAPDWQRLFEHIARGAAERERERILPFEAIDLLKRARFGALRLRKADGGAGASFRDLYAIAIRLAAADANVAHIFRNHFTVAEQYARAPHDDQGRAWQAQVRDGAIFGLASTETGANPAGGTQPDTLLTPEGDGYRLDGIKYYSTGTLYADSVLVRAADAQKRLASVIIPVKREGIEILDDWDGAGQRLTASGTTRYTHVRVAASEAVFDVPGRGYGLSYSNTQAQLFLTAVVAGIARAALDDAIALLKRRQRSFYYAHAPVPADDLLLQQTIGQLSANAFAAEAIVLAAADALDRTGAARDAGAPDGALAADAALAAAHAKIAVDELALRSGSLLFEAGGASATERRYNLDRHWRNARTIASHNPVSFKAQAIGALLVKDTPLPARGFF
ncbi:acyl-CoA dehydrogenase family protein [Roseixanthobacter liquoris]|uniref:acyl-CoA dehydrogenase family protein n=1 Tax=Roseixanthobacter liquoris TaxID=3119921 RepID=UPI003729942E